MKILLIQPRLNINVSRPEAPSLALLTLGTLAQNEGHVVKVVHCNVDVTADNDIGTIFRKFEPEIVGITINTFQVHSARCLVDFIKSLNIKPKIIIGGPHAPVFDREVDEVVIGEGENKFLEFIGSKTRLEDIDDIPELDYSLTDLTKFNGISPVGAYPSMSMMASRGCPYQCTFCNTPVFWGKKVRYKNPKLVVDEINMLRGRYGVKEIFFQDDTFNVNHEWAEDIFNRIIKEGLAQDMCFKICCRVNEKLMTEKFLKLAAKAGVWNIFFGIESGSQMMLDRMKKRITVEEIKRAIRMTHEVHIHSQCSFIIGMPGETRQTIDETFALVKEANPSSAGYCFACPFPMTELDDEVTARGHKKDLDYGDYGYGLIICRTDSLTYKDLEAYESVVYG